MTKLIALDMDGTLLFNHSHVSEGNKKELERAADMGIQIVGATGRPYNALTEDFLKLKGVRYIISSNGAVIWDLKEEKYIRKSYLSKEQAILILNAFGDLRDKPVWEEVCIDGKSYGPSYQFDNIPIYTSEPMMRMYFKTTRFPVDNMADFVMNAPEFIERVSCFSEDTEYLKHLRTKLINIPEITITQAQPRDLEVGHLDSSKGKALKYLCEYLGFETNEVISFGDGLNDVDMIEYAGLGIAMENAQDKVKQVANYVTDECEQDGVAKALKKFL